MVTDPTTETLHLPPPTAALPTAPEPPAEAPREFDQLVRQVQMLLDSASSSENPAHYVAGWIADRIDAERWAKHRALTLLARAALVPMHRLPDGRRYVLVDDLKPALLGARVLDTDDNMRGAR